MCRSVAEPVEQPQTILIEISISISEVQECFELNFPRGKLDGASFEGSYTIEIGLSFINQPL